MIQRSSNKAQSLWQLEFHLVVRFERYEAQNMAAQSVELRMALITRSFASYLLSPPRRERQKFIFPQKLIR